MNESFGCPYCPAIFPGPNGINDLTQHVKEAHPITKTIARPTENQAIHTFMKKYTLPGWAIIALFILGYILGRGVTP